MSEFMHHFLELWSDPAHFAYEVTVDLLVNTIFLGLLWPVLKRAVRRHDQEVHSKDHEPARTP